MELSSSCKCGAEFMVEEAHGSDARISYAIWIEAHQNCLRSHYDPEEPVERENICLNCHDTFDELIHHCKHCGHNWPIGG